MNSNKLFELEEIFVDLKNSDFIYYNYEKFFKLGFIIYLIIYTSYTFLDISLFPNHSEFFIINRILIATPAVLFPIIISSTNFYRKNFKIINSIALLIPTLIVINIFQFTYEKNTAVSVYYFSGLIIHIFILGLMSANILVSLIATFLVLIYYTLNVFYNSRIIIEPEVNDRMLSLLFTTFIATNIISVFFNTLNKKLINNENLLKKSLDNEKEKSLKIEKLNRQLYQSKYELEELLNYIKTPAILVDENGKILELNDERARIFGLPRTELKNKNLKEFLPVDKYNFRLNIFKNIKETNQTFKYERVEHGRHYEITVNPIHNEKGEIYKFAALYYDITERKELEIALKELNADKDKFFSIIAHDLKNPIANLKTFLELLYNDYHSIKDEEKYGFIKILKESSDNLYSLLENLLNWSRAQRGKIQFFPSEIDIKFIVNSIIELLSLMAKNKNISIINYIYESYLIKADPNLITTVLRNLLSNAIKFSHIDSKIEIGLIRNEELKEIQIFVKDSGVGIDKSIKENLFKIETNKGTIGTSGEIGTGLGLILCKEFIEMHKGKIWVDSELGVGSTFWISIPDIDK